MTLPIMVPPLPLQQEFADRVAEIESAAALSDKAVAVAEQLTQSLLAQVFGATACAEAPELRAP
jgi:type I restriction enzyme, S subunit